MLFPIMKLIKMENYNNANYKNKVYFLVLNQYVKKIKKKKNKLKKN
jgi:hypothetical protein